MENKYILLSFFLLFSICSCENYKKENIPKRTCINDSIIYKISIDAEIRLYNMIRNKKVFYCSLVSHSNENKYIFSFSYANKTAYTAKDSILVSRSNKYIQLKDLFFPIVPYTDILFSDIEDKKIVINDFNYCFIEVDALGNYITGFAY